MVADNYRGSELDPDSRGVVAQDVSDIDSRGRVRIPTRLVSAVSWCRNPTSASVALAVYDEPGRIMLLSWEEESAPVLARRRELIEKAKDSHTALDGLRVLEDRYKRLIVPKDFRPTLGAEALMHLDLPIGAESRVYILRVLETLEILSPRYRNKQRNANPDILAGLP